MGSWSLGMVSFLSLVLSSYVSAQSGSAPIGNTASFPASMDTTFRQMGDKFVASGRSDGLSIAVVYQGQVHFYNFGVISRSKRKAPTQRTVYEIGSISKAFTSLLLAHAVSDGKVKIDDDIRKYLPGNYPKLEFDGTPVHLVDLVDHTSALPDNLPVPTDELKKMKPQESTFRVNEILTNYTVADMLRDLSESSLDHRPGTEPRHSNVSMEVLAAVLENVYHDSYPHLLSHYIEKPFGMASGFGYARRPKFSTGYDEEHREMPFYTGSIAVPAGGLRYSPQDMARFLQGELGSPDAAIRLSHQVQWGEDEAGAFAYDWYMDRTIDNQLHLRSSGGTFAFSSYIEMYPAQGYGVVLLANRMNYTGNTQGELQQLSAEARAAIWGKAPVQTALENELQKNDYRNVAATVAKIRAAHPELRLSENYVNEWGYHFTAAKQFDAAIGLFQYNVATFPGSWNAWDSLAEGYEMSGDKRNAIDNYRHSLELNPANTHAVEALKRLNAMQ